MNDFSVEATARKWCTRHCDERRALFYPNLACECGQITAAIREALGEVEKAIHGHATRLAEADQGKKRPTKETAGDVGLLTALACEIHALYDG